VVESDFATAFDVSDKFCALRSRGHAYVYWRDYFCVGTVNCVLRYFHDFLRMCVQTRVNQVKFM
jgi:hypothetical protein